MIPASRKVTSTPGIRPNPYGAANRRLTCSVQGHCPPIYQNQTERKQALSKTKAKQTTAVATASEPIIVNGVEFTPKMIADLTALANLEAGMKEDKKNSEKLKGVYKPFFEANEAVLRDGWVRVGNLRAKLEVSRSLKVEIVD